MSSSGARFVASAAVPWARFSFNVGELRIVGLTLDDAVTDDVTPELLAALEEFNATATFFCIGSSVRGREGMVRQIVEQGHEVRRVQN